MGVKAPARHCMPYRDMILIIVLLQMVGFSFFAPVSESQGSASTITGTNQNDLFGWNVSSTGDVNGDGFDDIIVGAPGYDNNRGRAYIFFGGPWFNGDLVADIANVTLNGGAQGDRFGWDVSGAGDVNNDGFNDTIVGAPGNNSLTGVAYIFRGNSSMPAFINAADANAILVGESAGDVFGSSISNAGDVNDDGYDDVIVGAPGNNSMVGAAYIFLGNDSNGIMVNASKANFTATGYSAGAAFGFSVSGAGDVNNDNYDDVIIGAPAADKAYIFYGGDPMNSWVQTSKADFDSAERKVHINTTAIIVGEAQLETFFNIKAMMAYLDDSNPPNTPEIPRNRTWNQSAWTLETNANSGGPVPNQWFVIKSGTVRKNEKVLAVSDAASDIYSQVSDGLSWSFTVKENNAISDQNCRGFDVAYESISGDAIHAYWDETSGPAGRLRYRIWDGTGWSLPGEAVQLGEAGRIVHWVVLASNPLSDEILMVTLDDRDDIYAQIWDGDNWGNSQLIVDAASRNDMQCFDAVYEQQSGYGMVVWGDDSVSNTDVSYRRWKGDWSEAQGSLEDADNQVNWIKLAADPKTNYIISGTLDSGNEIDALIWDGSAWSTPKVKVTTNAERDSERCFDLAWETTGNTEGLLAYGVNDDRPAYRKITGTSIGIEDFSLDANIADNGDPNWIVLNSDPQTDDIMMMYLVNDGFGAIDDIGVELWNGTGWENDQNIENNGDRVYESFSHAYTDASGYFISSSYNANIQAPWGRIRWTAEIPPGTTLRLRTRSSSDNATWSSWSEWYANGERITSPKDRWIQYQAWFETTNVTLSPILHDVTIELNRPDVIINGTSGDNFGWSVTELGNVNNDFNSDVIIGAPQNNSKQGSAYVFFGENWPTGTYLNAAFDTNVTLTGENTGDNFGYSVSGAGNFSFDGLDDIVVGAPNATKSGTIYIFFGSTSMGSILSASNADVAITGDSELEGFGWSVARAGNITSTGYDEIVVGAPYFDDMIKTDAGKVYIYNLHYQPDIMINGGGDDEYQDIPTGLQIKLSWVIPGNNITYYMQLGNDGTLPDTYDFNITTDMLAGWVWKITDNISAEEITDSHNVSLSTGENRNYTVNISVPISAVHDEESWVTVIVVSQNDTTKKDAVKALARALDATPPEIADTTFGTPTTGDTYTITATVTDNIGLDNVSLYYWFDLYGGGTDGPYNVTMNPGFFLDINAPLDAVVIHYNITANDTSNNWNETGEIIIGVMDNDAPSLMDTTPGSPTTGDTFQVTATVTDNIDVGNVYLYYWFDLYGGGTDGPYNVTMDPGYLKDISVPSNAVTLHYNISANDTSNNWNETGEIVIGVVDNDTPSLMDTTPGSPTTGDTFQVTATVTDNIDVGNVYLYYWFDLYGGGTDGPYNVTMDPGYSKDLSVPSNAVALHYNISANDTINNWNETGEIIIGGLDNDLPVILDTTSGSPTTGDTFQITATVTDNINTSEIRLYFWFDLFGGGTDGPYYLAMDPGYSKDVSVPSNAVFLHYNISANDTSNNWNETGELVIGVLDNDTPSVIDTTPGSPTTGDTFQITVTVTDNIDVGDVYLYYWFDLFGGGIDGPYNVTMDPGFSKDINVPDNAIALHYNISANDTTDNWNETGEFVIGVLDNDLPSILDTTSGSPTTGDTFQITATVTDNIDVGDVYLYYWFDLYGGGTDGPYNVKMDPGFSKDIIVPSNAVALHYNISANDTTNNWNETGEIVIGVMDNDLPSILDTTPGSPTTDDIFQITTIVTDNINVTDVYLYYWFDLYGGGIDGPYNISMDPGFLKDINVPSNAVALHYNISANDTVNNWNETGEVTIGVLDNDLPVILDTTLGSPITGDTFQITATITDNIDIGDVYLYYWFDLFGGGTDGPYYVTMDPGFSKNIVVPSNAIILHYYISANDTSDNWEQTIQYDLSVTDNDLPSITDTTSGSPTTGDFFNITATVTDNIAVDEAYLYYWFETGVGPTTPQMVVMNSMGGGDYDLQISVPANGLVLHYNISAKDTANNQDETGDTTIAILDNDLPLIIDVSSSPQTQEIGSWVNITIEAQDSIGVNQVLLNITSPNGSWIITGMSKDAGDGWFHNTSFDSPGNYSYQITVTDSEGNNNLSTAKQFQIIPPPVPGVDYIQINTAPNNGGVVLDSEVYVIGDIEHLYAAAFNNSIGYLGDVEVTWLCNNAVAGEVIPTYGSNTTFTALGQGTGTLYAIYNIIENSTEFEVLPRQEPTILGTIPDLELYEDFGKYKIDLTQYAHDDEDSKSYLRWYITGENDSVIYINDESKVDNHEILFISMKDMHDNMEVTYWLVDSDGYLAWQQAWINVTPVNDPPEIWGCPDIYVHYDTPYTFDYSAYVSDLDTPLSEMTLTCDVEGYSSVSGLDITYTYPQSMVGRDMYATLTISDGELSDSELIMITVTTDYPPESLSQLPDIIIYENDTIHNVFDLDDFISDPDGDSLYMSYGYTHLNITINDDHTVDFSALGEWTGTETVTFRAEDPMGAMVEQTIIVTVVNVNDPPAIKPLPPFVVHYGHPFIFDLFWYISDNDNETEELVITTSNPDNVSVEGTVLTLIYPEHWEGQPQPYIMPLIVYVSDGVFMVSGVTTVKVGDDYPPQLTKPMEDLSFFEDEPAIGAYNLDEHFGDIDSSTMFYTSGNVRINVTIHENHTVDFSAPTNWHGSEYILIRASDMEGAFTEATILVTVLQVNDPPQIADLPAQFGEKGKTWVLDLEEYISDIDNDLGNLNISVDSPYVSVVGYMLVFSYPGDITEDTVEITVSDGDLETTVPLNVVITTASVPPKEEPWLWFLIILILVVAVLALLLARIGIYKVEDVFLITNSGLLIEHAGITQNEKQTGEGEEEDEKDDDILAAMFVAVQQFIKDAFSKDSEDEDILKRMDYGDKTVMIFKGDYVILSAFLSGQTTKSFYKNMEDFVVDVEERYKHDFEKWGGTVGSLTGIREMMNSFLDKSYVKGE